MMISSHKNNTCGLKSQQENKSYLNPPKKETWIDRVQPER